MSRELKPRLLLMEESPSLLHLLWESLGEGQFCLETWEGGRPSSSALLERKPDLILAPLRGRQVNGLRLCKQFKKREREGYTPFILVTSDGSSKLILEGLAAGADDCLSLPARAQELASRIRLHLSLKRRFDAIEERLSELGRREAEAEAATEIGRILAFRGRSLYGKLRRCLAITLAQVEAEHGSLMLLNEQGQLEVKIATRADLEGRTRELSEQGVSTLALREGKSVFVEDIRADPRFEAQWAHHYRKDFALTVPIRHEGQVFGVLNVSERQVDGPFAENDAAIRWRFTQKIAPFLENARLREALRRERDELRRQLKLNRQLMERTAAQNEALRRERESLEAANARLRELERVKSDLTHMVIHDLKGPLSEIMSNLDLIMAGELAEEDRECFETAMTGSERMLRMINDMLDISRMEEGRLSLRKERVELDLLAEKALERLSALAAQRGISLRQKAAEGLPPVEADRQLLERVLDNILTNAITYSPEGGVVTVATEVPGGGREVRVSVTDEGEGIAPGDRERIFEKFSQGEGGRQRRKGAGLGLAFCRMATEAHGGRIWVESGQGRGSSFFFTIPV
ncbi:MAG: ATP-binding protein [Nitrospinota bacterium]